MIICLLPSKLYLYMKIIIIFSTLLIFFSCINNQKKSIKEADCIIVDVNISEESSFDLSELSKEEQWIKLETNDSCLIEYIRKLYYVDNKIVVGDDNSILFFDVNGKFKYRVDRQGGGPEEYNRLSDFDICKNNKQIYILDTGKKQILKYDLSGNYINNIKIDFWAIGIQLLNDSTCLLYSGNQMSSECNNKFAVIDMKNDKTLNRFGVISANKSKYLHVYNKTNFSINNNHIAFYEFYNDTIYTLYDKGCKADFYLNFNKMNIPKSYFDRNYENIIEFQNEINRHDFVFGISSLIQISNSSYIATYFHNKMRRLLYYSQNKSVNKSFSQLSDNILFDNIVVDLKKYEFNFFSDDGYLFVTSKNELYIDKLEYIKNDSIKKIFSGLREDDNPIIRISRLNSDDRYGDCADFATFSRIIAECYILKTTT